MKALVIEDEPELADVLVRSLEREGYVVERAADHRKAVTKIADHASGSILPDIMLPGGSGLDVLRQFKAMAGWACAATTHGGSWGPVR